MYIHGKQLLRLCGIQDSNKSNNNEFRSVYLAYYRNSWIYEFLYVCMVCLELYVYVCICICMCVCMYVCKRILIVEWKVGFSSVYVYMYTYTK